MIMFHSVLVCCINVSVCFAYLEIGRRVFLAVAL